MADTVTAEPGLFEVDHDVVTVGGGPAGCSAGVLPARVGLATAVDDSRSSHIGPREIEVRAGRGHRTLAAHPDPAASVDTLDGTALLEAMDDETVRRYVDADGRPAEVFD